MKTTQVIKFTLSTIIALSFYTSCAPETKTVNSIDKKVESSSQIFGGVESDIEFQKENGVVGLMMFTTLFDENGEPVLDEDGKTIENTSTCTGSLIDRKIILTAAHCVTNDSLKWKITRIATIFSNNFNILKKENVIFVKAVLPHEDYLKDVDFENPQDKTIWNDIALLKLSAEAPLDFKTAKLPQTQNSITNSNKPKTLLLSGFGIATPIVNRILVTPERKVKNLITGEIRIIPSKTEVLPVREPVRTSGKLRHVEGIKVVSVTDDQKEILLDQTGKKGACHGDSGGPAYAKTSKTDSSLIQVGLTSRGTNKIGNCNEGAIYTALSGHLDWISTNSAKLLAK